MGTFGARRCLIKETEARHHQLRRDQGIALIYCVRVRRIETEPNTEEGINMYVIKRHHTLTGELAYFKYDGWEKMPDCGPLDLTGVVLFTEGERKANTLRPNEEWQWYGCYKR